MRRLATCSFVILMACGAAAAAHRGEQLPPYLFPAQLILDAREDIRLNTEQIKAVDALIQEHEKSRRATSQAIAPESKKLLLLLAEPRIDEAQALAQMEAILNLEREGRRADLLNLIRLKNLLSQEQQSWLELVRKRRDAGSVVPERRSAQ